MGKKNQNLDQATKQYREGLGFIAKHPMFSPLAQHAQFIREERSLCPEQGWAVVAVNGLIHVHPKRRAEPEEWIFILAHCLLHLGFSHFRETARPELWNTACDLVVNKFLLDMKLGKPPAGLEPEFFAGVGRSEEEWYEAFLEKGLPAPAGSAGTAGPGCADLLLKPAYTRWGTQKFDWPGYFGRGLSMAVTSAVNVSAGQEAHLGADRSELTPALQAKNWFINSYPLIGSLATVFKVIEDPLICQRMNIAIAAVDAEAEEIYMNPAAGLDEQEARFVMAHEILHVGLRHHARTEGRDAYLWNVACDYVINQWLMEIGIGTFPRIGGLLDPELKGLSAEAVYDRIVTDMRLYRKLATFRGTGLGDILEPRQPDWWKREDGVTLDEFYRSALSQGLSYHEEQGRGLLPAGLMEEIKALLQPPIPWDVELAKWFDDYFAPLERVRTYARLSRRQSSTPDIPRPKWVPYAEDDAGRTYGVVLDTSGSMDSKLLGKALGAISSYSISRDVPFVRVVYCDAAVYDQGYMAPEDIADHITVKGRGGTVLQPAIDLLEKAEDFPANAPLLIITDGDCDKLTVRREHAYILPKGQHLPFIPKGKVFRVD